MPYDCLIIGAGLSGLTAAALLSKRGLRVGIIDNNYNPGGSCGTFKRNGVIFDQGSSMLYGFGEAGFAPHRFIFNCLEEPIDMIKHDLLYAVNYRDKPIYFYADLDKFVAELCQVFPSEAVNIPRFYRHISKIYHDVMVEYPSFTTPDETDPRHALRSIVKHPGSYIRFLSYLNMSAETLLKRFFKDPEIFKFFDKLTSTYCYTSVKETPAVLACIMFVDNHFGGSYYPAGSSVHLPGKLEKVIEENGGTMIMNRQVKSIDFTNNIPSGVTLDNGEKLTAESLIYSGTVWNLYDKLLPKDKRFLRTSWVKHPDPTYPSVAFYACVDASVIPASTLPVEMLVGNPDKIDEAEVTVYVPSIDDFTLTEAGTHVVMAIGPSFAKWDRSDKVAYAAQKKVEKIRLIGVLERRFPGISGAIRFSELATPATIERYCLKNGGAVAGPKQKIGQHMFKRLHTRSEWKNLFYCGESATMGTGTPAVSVSGLSAANALLKQRGLKPYVYSPDMQNFVHLVPKPFLPDHRYQDETPEKRQVMLAASRCLYCEHPTCANHDLLDVRGINRRVTVGNFVGAIRKTDTLPVDAATRNVFLATCETRCVLVKTKEGSVKIRQIVGYLMDKAAIGRASQ